MFGSIEVDVDGRLLGVQDFGGRKPKQLLQILLCERGHALAKDRIADLLWGEAPPRNPTATLETYVCHLRRRLTPKADDTRVLLTEPAAYRLDVEGVDVDLDRFDELSQRGGRANLTQALALVRGEVLEDEPYGTWALRLRETYRERRITVMLDLAEEALADGDPIMALELADSAVSLEPARERGYRASMLARYALGRQDEALRALDRCRAALAELGIEPLPETVALHAAILRHEDLSALLPGRLRSRAPSASRLPVARVPLLGRVEELASLQQHCEYALCGPSSVVVIHGEAGIGKTRLVDELLARLPDVPVGRAKCFPLGSDLPFFALAEAIRSLGGLDRLQRDQRRALGEFLPELGRPQLAPQTARSRGFESLAALVTARAPLVLFVDDLQWADASTVAALAFLARRCASAPLLIVIAYRSEEAEHEHPAHRLQADVVLELGALEPMDLAPLGIDRLYEDTAGHPLFLVERLRADVEEGADRAPETLRDLILARCRAAGPQAHRILAAASVLGRSFDPVVLARMLDAPMTQLTEELEALCRRRLLDVVGMRFDFRHDLMRDALLARLSPARRQALHARALDALEESATDPGELARHAEEAGAWDHAVRWSVVAATSAEAQWANIEAVAHLERARRCSSRAEPDDPAGVEALLLRLGRLLVRIGRTPEAEALLHQASASAETRGDDRSLFEALDAQTAARHRGAGSPSDALAHANHGLEVAERIGDPALLGRAHIAIGNASGSLGRLQEAVDHCHLALGWAENAGAAPPALAAARIGLVMHHWAREEEALIWSGRAEAVALDHQDEETLVMSRWVRALSCAALGRYWDAWLALDAIGTIGHGEEVFWHARVPNTYGSILTELCLYEQALERNCESLDVARSSVLKVVREAELQTVLNVAADQLGLGRPGEAAGNLEFVRTQVEHVEDARFRYLSRLHFLDAQVALALGEPERAMDAANECMLMAERHGLPKYEVRGRLALASALAGTGEVSRGRTEARQAAGLADRLGDVGLSWRAWWTAYAMTGSAVDRRRAQAGVQRVAAMLADPKRSEFLRSVPVEA